VQDKETSFLGRRKGAMIPIDKLLEKTGDRYTLTTVVAKRAKQISEGATPLVELDKPHKPIFVAIQEVVEDKIEFYEPQEDDLSPEQPLEE
jgi:DNA-directed RNA polymerase subunit omega